MVERRVARVVVLDEQGAVLLLSARIPRRPDGPDVWFTPGGGVEEGETLAEAAHREVLEETGGRLGDLGEPVWEHHREFRFEGRQFVQDEWYFVVRTTRYEVRPTALTEFEAATTTGWRWWQLEDLATTSARVVPEGLAALVEGWLAG